MFLLVFLLFTSCLQAAEFTVSTYNCGGLSDHYDYVREVAMQKLMQERYTKEPALLSRIEKAERLALKILFAPDAESLGEWKKDGYQELIDETAHASEGQWFKKSEEIVTSYKIRPIGIKDHSLEVVVQAHMNDLIKGEGIHLAQDATLNEKLDVVRSVMAKRIFQNDLTYDIICLQEADYLTSDLFPENYEVLFSDTEHSVNGVAWNKERFAFLSIADSNGTRFFAVKLQDLETKKEIIVGTGHLTGCNPFTVVHGDSRAGDTELQALINAMDEKQAALSIIGMDANVTAHHPRLSLLKEANYTLDYQNFIEPTCTNPNAIVNTKIDWIAVKGNARICNIPVHSVPLNNLRANMSDHKPIAAKIEY